MLINKSAKSKLIATVIATILIAAMLAMIIFAFLKAFTPDFKDIIDEKCDLYQVDKILVYAMIKTESDYDSGAVSKKGAIGLMQIMPGTAGWLTGEAVTPDMLEDPRINLDIGIAYLSRLNKKYSDSRHVLSAYNAGEGRVDEWIKEGTDFNDLPYKETKNYLKKIKAYKFLYDILW